MEKYPSEVVTSDDVIHIARTANSQLMQEPDKIARLFGDRDLGRYAQLLLALGDPVTGEDWQRIVVNDMQTSSTGHRSRYHKENHIIETVRPVRLSTDLEYDDNRDDLEPVKRLADRRAFRPELDTRAGSEQLIGTLAVYAAAYRGQEEALTEIAHEGLRAEQVLVEANARLIMFVARRFASSFEYRMADRIVPGYEGLKYAVRNYDPSLGASFSSYAIQCIGGYMLTHYKRFTADRLNLTVREAVAIPVMRKAEDDLEYELQRPPTVAEIAAQAKMSEERVARIKNALFLSQTVSLERPVGGHDDLVVGGNLSVDPFGDAAEKESTSDYLQDKLGALFTAAGLSARQQQALRALHGLHPFEQPLTVPEAAENFDVSIDTVKRWRASGYRRITRAVGSSLETAGLLKGFIYSDAL